MKTWIIVLIAILAVLVIGAIIIPLPQQTPTEKECSINNSEGCDISCNVDEDCMRFSYEFDFCFNKEELNPGITGQAIETMDNITLTIKGCKCTDNKCQST